MKKKYWMISLIIIGFCVAGIYLMVTKTSVTAKIGGDTTDTKAEETVRIGFSQLDQPNPWRVAQLTSFVNAASDRGYELVYHQPAERTEKWQINDIKALLEEHVSYLALAPINQNVLHQAVQMTKEKNVMLILLECDADDVRQEDYFTLVSTDYYKEGQLCAQILGRYFKGEKCRVLEVTGESDSQVAGERAQGFYDEINKGGTMKIVYSIHGNFDRVTAQKSMEEVIVNPKIEYDAIVAYSDEDGLGVLQALKVAGKNHGTVPIVSINGVQDVLKAIIAGEYYATVESNPNTGAIVMQVIASEREGYLPAKRIFVPYNIYDGSNAVEEFNNAY